MARFERFEDIQAWQEARALTRMIYSLSESGKFSKDYGLTNQIRRASVSIMSNIAEGFERRTKKEFQHFLYIAKGSAGEVRAQVYVALDLGYIDEDTFNAIMQNVTLISRMIMGLIGYLSEAKIGRT